MIGLDFSWIWLDFSWIWLGLGLIWLGLGLIWLGLGLILAWSLLLPRKVYIKEVLGSPRKSCDDLEVLGSLGSPGKSWEVPGSPQKS